MANKFTGNGNLGEQPSLKLANVAGEQRPVCERPAMEAILGGLIVIALIALVALIVWLEYTSWFKSMPTGLRIFSIATGWGIGSCALWTAYKGN